MTSQILRNTRLYTRQLNEQEMDILAAWLETLDPVNPGEEAAEITVVLHHSLRQNNRANASSGIGKTSPQTSTTFTPPHHPKSHAGSQNGYGNNSTSYAATTRSEGNSSPDWKSSSRQVKSFRPPPIFIPGVPNLPQVKTYNNTDSIDERISPEMVRMKNYGATPVTAIRTHCPLSVLSNDMTKNGVQSVSNSPDPPTRQNERLDSRVANWIRNTSSNSSYLGHQSKKNPSKGTSTSQAKRHDSANDPAILALMTAVVEEKKVEEARTSPRLMGSSERVIYASSNSSTSSRDRRVPASSRPRGYPYLKSDLHRDTGRLGMYQSDLPLTYSHI
ncbi:hypothetical protein BHYA_0242g00130 [Botrytis hyacinthi]|uniref:Uncharacterized protein n=1 Tax=Botrytis hyacinthi TaxID=278943 RepID=A0A4Z1GDH0_9HELO|nr:hypothetical protein BHYA_0242g00130 [Botrytis hyacinthi]